jgi:hypothetical protein
MPIASRSNVADGVGSRACRKGWSVMTWWATLSRLSLSFMTTCDRPAMIPNKDTRKR